MPEKKKQRSDQEWMDLIRECRTSGLPDREWCRIHSISINTFHNKVSALRKKAFEIPGPPAGPSRQKHEVVPLRLADCTPAPCSGHSAGRAQPVPSVRPAVTVRMAGYSIETADGAPEDTIHHTLLALGRLC